MTMKTLKSISTAMKLIDGKKEDLKKALEELQLQPISHPTFSNLKWEELDSYFTSLHSNLLHKFTLLQSQHPEPVPEPKPKLDPVPARPDLKSICEKMDGHGLRNYAIDRPKERAAIRVELVDAYKHAPDPAGLVLEAMQGFWPDGAGYGEFGGVRRVCTVLLEEFSKVGAEIGAEVKEKARELAVQWKGKVENSAGGVSRRSGSGGGSRRRGVGGEEAEEGLEKLGLLHLLVAFGLEKDAVLGRDELVDYAVSVARCRQAVELCHALGFEDEIISDVVKKLIDMGKQLLAVKFICQFELTNEFPPVPLLQTYVSDSKKLAQKVRNKGKGSRQALNEAAAKEISSLKSVIRIIEDHNLESQYPKRDLLKCVEKLEKEKTSKKRVSAIQAAKSSQPPPKQQKTMGNRTTRRNTTAVASGIHYAAATSTIPPIQQSYVQTAGLLVDPYLNSPAVAAYGLAGATPASAPFVGASTTIYGSGTPVAYSGNLDPSLSNPYPSESQTQPTYYDRSLVYGGYGLQPEYHVTYRPQ